MGQLMPENKCKYAGRNCKLLATILIRVGVRGHWCWDKCWPNHRPAQLAMLKARCPALPDPPDEVDLLEWLEQSLADGTLDLPDVTAQTERQKQRQLKYEAERARLIAVAEELELPNAAEQVANLGKHLLEVHRFAKANGGRKYVTDPWFGARNYICSGCPSGRMKLVNEVMRCADCGCHLDRGKLGIAAKNRYEALTCQRGHHAATDACCRAQLGLELPAEVAGDEDSDDLEPAFNGPVNSEKMTGK